MNYRSKIKAVLNGNIDKKAISKLAAMGVTLITGKKHYKFDLNGDSKYRAIAPKTPSDIRSYKNLASEICRNMF